MQRLSIREVTGDGATIDASIKDFPCPECSPKVSEDQIVVLGVTQEIVAHSRIPEHVVLRTAADALASKLLETDSLLTLERGAVDTERMTYKVRATVGVVSKNAVASLEDRVSARQGDVAIAAGNAAIDAIDNWGSAYNEIVIRKDAAARAIREAVNETVKTFRKL
jgi:hypothetical protein